MKKARIEIDGQTFEVEAYGFVQARDANPKVTLSPSCLACGQRAYLNDEKGARNFRTVNHEITKRGKQQRLPGFSHHPKNPDKDCVFYLADDPRFKGILSKNVFQKEERDRNITIVNAPKMRSAIDDMQQTLMKHLTGEPQISDADKKRLNDVEKKLMSWVGLADHPWIVGYLAPVLMGSRLKQFRSTVNRVEYKPVGEQSIPVKGLDGQSRDFSIPRELRFSFSNGDDENPEAIKLDGKPLIFKISAEDAANLVREARGLPPRSAQPTQRCPQYKTQMGLL